MTTKGEKQFTGWNRFKETISTTYRMFLLLLTVFLLLPADGFCAYPFPDTGQTKCYNNSGEITCPSPGQAFYGQDAQYNFHPRSYTKLDSSGNALSSSATSWTMVRDNVTGLIWEMKTDDNSIHDKDKTFTWCDTNPATNGGNQGTCGTGTGDAATDTEAFINALNNAHYGGYSDWRMPTVKELSALVNSSIPYPGPTIDAEWFPYTVSSYCWSFTTYANYNYLAWIVGFDDGGAGGDSKSNSNYVRAVRGSQTSSNLVDNGDGTVTDTSTGLMWQKATGPGTYTWEGALNYVANLNSSNYLGYNDWRLPDRNELQSLVDCSRYDPAIDPLLASDAMSSDYWSSTTNTSTWSVYFGSGYVHGNDQSGSNYVRAVRTARIAPIKNDFNGDGITDLLWRNETTGQINLWFMNADGTRASSKTLITDTTWTVAGTGDFNADGITDILWRQASTGKVNLWFMKTDGTRSGTKTLITDPHWTVAGTGDFNRDGISDILWRQASTGKVNLWFMNPDGSRASSKTLITDTSWTVAGTGNFNLEDLVTDILWRQESTGKVVLWIMTEVGTRASAKTLITDSSWAVAGTGNFNTDGIFDILWRQTSTGKVVLWFMNASFTRASSKTLVTDTTWTVAGTGDFNGDGISDILWRQVSTGKVVLWFMNADGTRASYKTLMTDPTWTVVGQ